MRAWDKAIFSFFLVFGAYASGDHAFAQTYDTRRYHESGAWYVELTHNTQTGSLWCAAEAENAYGQAVSITGYSSGGLVLFFFDPDWTLVDRPVTFLVDIDYSRWTMSGHGRNTSVSIEFTEPEKTRRFIDQLRAGTAVALFNERGSRLALFSLFGSRSSIDKLMECWRSIQDLASEANSSDPFGGVVDPF